MRARTLNGTEIDACLFGDAPGERTCLYVTA